MAEIDRIYGNYPQYLELKKYIFDNREKIKKETGEDPKYDIYILEPKYEKLWRETPNEIYAISNFSHKIDNWLIKNCKIEFVVERLKIQYVSRFRRITNKRTRKRNN